MLDPSLAATIVRLDAWFAPERDLALQAYSGSAWRGAFGHALKRAVCVMRQRPCADCALRTVCLFPGLFPDKPAADPPMVPFVLAPAPSPRGCVVAAGTPVAVRLTLVPPATDHALYALRALIDCAQGGIGPGRVPLALAAIAPVGQLPRAATHEAIGDAIAPRPFSAPAPPGDVVRVDFVTPFRLRLDGDLVTGRDFAPHHLVSAALRRIEGLLGLRRDPTWRTIVTQARGLAWTRPRFGWLETVRRSTRQQATMRLGGIVGGAELDIAAVPQLWPVLWWASVLHVGKGASMGFGRLEVAAA